MATLTKKDLLEAIEDMPMDAPIWSEINEEPMLHMLCNRIESAKCHSLDANSFTKGGLI